MMRDADITHCHPFPLPIIYVMLLRHSLLFVLLGLAVGVFGKGEVSAVLTHH